jgi:hypothetical protein
LPAEPKPSFRAVLSRGDQLRSVLYGDLPGHDHQRHGRRQDDGREAFVSRQLGVMAGLIPLGPEVGHRDRIAIGRRLRDRPLAMIPFAPDCCATTVVALA